MDPRRYNLGLPVGDTGIGNETYPWEDYGLKLEQEAALRASSEPGAVQSASGLFGPEQQSPVAQAQPQPQGQGQGFMDILSKVGAVMEGMSAGYRGQPNPVVQRKLEEAQLQQRQQQIEMQKQQAVTGKFNVLFDFLQHMDVDEKTNAKVMGAFLKTFPDTGEFLTTQGIDPEQISIGRKGEKLTLKNREVKAGQYIDPVTKEPVPEGRYDIEGQWKQGQFIPRGFSPTEKEAKTYDQLLIDTAQKKFPKDEAKQEAFVAQRKKEQAVQVRVEGARGSAQAGVEGREAGYQKVLAQRLDRIRQETEAVTGGRPLDAAAQERVSGLLAARRQVANIETNLDPDFLGPIKGTGAAFEVRRRVGSYIDSPLGSREVIFRESLADAADMLLRARSGAQINEDEYKRLSGMLPKATDEEKVFKAGLLRFDNELAKTIESRIQLGTTPRNQLGSSASKSEPLRNKSKSGKPIISKDGGKTWEYE